MPNELVKHWFGNQFYQLHPLLQRLHTHGGKLRGDIEIVYGKGLAGIIGRALAKRMNFPNEGLHQLEVNISHESDGLHWTRRFDSHAMVKSIFTPVGHIDQGYWIETTGLLTFHLTVDIKRGGWFWRCLEIKALGMPLPTWLIPRANAFKFIENNQYRFQVEFTLPVIGALVSYQGLLDADYNDGLYQS